jgi:hypothetical protein
VPTSRVHAEQALAVYAEPLGAGRRVVVFADPTSALAERLEQIDASEVVYVGPDDDLDELRGARFDLAIVADLGVFGDADILLSWVRRVVGDSGVALVCALNRDAAESDVVAFDYYALFDLVAQQFAEVRMVAELPFHGITLAEMGDENESPAVSVDTQLAEGDRTPAAFLAVASQRAVDLDPYAIIELPAEADGEDARALDEARAVLAAEQLRVRALAAHVDALQEQAGRAAELQAKLDSKARQLSALSVEVEHARASADAGRVAAAQMQELALRTDRAETALAGAEAELGRVSEAHAVELAAFERALRDRAQAVRALEAEVARRERMVRELVSALEEEAPEARKRAEPNTEEGVRPPQPTQRAEPDDDGTVGALAEENARLRQKLDALALELARREGESQASAWSIVELERRLATAVRSGPERERGSRTLEEAPSDLERRLAAALDELDALRRAMVKEHEARVRAESGEELARARREIQRQAVLLEQLGRLGQEVQGT